VISIRQFGKVLQSRIVHILQYNTALALCMLDKYGTNTDRQSQYLILTAFPGQGWLRQRT